MKSGQTTVTVVLIILLVGAVGYIVFDKYQLKQQQEQISIYQQGAQAGYEQAIVQLVQQGSTCNQVPVKVQNQTISFIAVECLKTQEQQTPQIESNNSE